MTIKGKAYIAGAYEHPTRHAPDKTVAQLHAEVALGALKDAGLSRDDVDGYFCAGDAPGPGPATMAAAIAKFNAFTTLFIINEYNPLGL